jgi:putative cardiolipin synthase
MSLFNPASRLGRGAGAMLALVVATGCAVHYAKYPRSPSTAFQEYHATTLGRLFEPAAAKHPGESGVLYMRYGPKALVARLALADLAERSLDLQYFIWDADISGHLLADRIIRAADCGRVRVLVDDLHVVDRDTAIAQLSAHPNMEIRLNPFRAPQPADGLHHRLPRASPGVHNKVAIADNAIAIVGGATSPPLLGVHGESTT